MARSQSKVLTIHVLRETKPLTAIDAWRQLPRAPIASGAALNLGKSDQRFWLDLEIRSEADEQAMLELSNPFIYQLQLYAVDADSLHLITTTGIDYPFAERPVDARRFAFPLQLKKGLQHYILMADRRKELLRFTLSLQTLPAYYHEQAGDALFFGSLFGILLFIIAFNLAMWLILRDRIHLWYLGYVAFMLLFILTDNGFGYQWIWPRVPLLQKYLRSMLGLGALAMQVQFMMVFLDMRAWKGRLVRLCRLVIWLCVLLLVSFIVAAWAGSRSWAYPPWLLALQQGIFYGNYLLGIVLVILCSIHALRRGNSSGKIYLMALAPIVLLILIVMASRWQLLKGDLDTPRYLALALVTEIIILGCGIIVRYNRLRKERAALATALEQQERQNLKDVLQAQEQERERIARDLHDQLGGTLGALRGMISGMDPGTSAAGLQQAATILDEACTDLRSISHDLMPPRFQSGSLPEALDEAVSRMNQQAGTRISFVQAGQPRQLDRQLELNLYRITLELLNNMLKHAQAKHAYLQLIYHPDHLYLMLEDDGKGFDTALLNHSGIGLKNLYSRARLINATIEYDSGPTGTTAVCTLFF